MTGVALIGTGYWGKNLARCLHQLQALRCLCDQDVDRLAAIGSTCPGVDQVTDIDAVLRREDVEALVIATPAQTHADLACRAMRAGKDVFVEKPMALDVDAATEMVRLADQLGRVLMVGHLLHYHPCIRALQGLIADGALGRLRYVTSNRLNLGRIRTEENALWSFAPHDFSVITALAGGVLPDQVRCTGEAHLTSGVADTTLSVMRFAGGLRAHVYVSWLNPFKEQRLTVVGDHGLAVFDDTLDWDRKLAIFRSPVRWQEGQLPVAEKTEPEFVEVERQEPLLEECRHFLHCVATRQAPRTDGAEGLRVLTLLRSAQRSLEQDGEAVDPGTYRGVDEESYFAHPSAVIDAGAAVGAGTKIWHFSHVMTGAEIGRDCNLGQNVVVSPGVVLGQSCKVQNNVSLYTGLRCEDAVFIGPSVVFTNVTTPRSEFPRRDQYESTTLRHGATIGANATIVCGIELGRYAFVGAGAVVTRDVPAFALVLGNPARQVGWMSKEGERLPLPVTPDPSAAMECVQGSHRYSLTDTGLQVLALDREPA